MSSAFDLQRSSGTAQRPNALSELEHCPARINKVRKIITSLPPGAKILDVGCSDGTILAPFTSALEIHGIDGVPKLVDHAKAKGIQAVIGDVENLPFDSAFFDYVFSGEVIEHTLSPDRYLSEINRVLKPNGTLIMTAPNIRTPVGMFMLLLGYPPMYAARYRSSHLRDFTSALLKRALTSNGFAITSFKGSAFMIPPLGPKLPWLADIFPNWADNFILTAQKMQYMVYDPSIEYRML